MLYNAPMPSPTSDHKVNQAALGVAEVLSELDEITMFIEEELQVLARAPFSLFAGTVIT